MRRDCIVVVTVTRRYRIIADDDRVNGRPSLQVLSDQIKHLESHPNPVAFTKSFTGFSTTEAVEDSRVSVEIEKK